VSLFVARGAFREVLISCCGWQSQ